jgi:hypothetical protein
MGVFVNPSRLGIPVVRVGLHALGGIGDTLRRRPCAVLGAIRRAVCHRILRTMSVSGIARAARSGAVGEYAEPASKCLGTKFVPRHYMAALMVDATLRCCSR